MSEKYGQPLMLVCVKVGCVEACRMQLSVCKQPVGLGLSAQVSVRRSAAASWPQSHASQAGGGLTAR